MGVQFSFSTVCIWNAPVAYLSRGIDDLCRIVLSIILDNATECVLDCRVVAFNEVVFNKSDRERRFAYDTANVRLDTNGERVLEKFIPTERLPTTAIFRCLGAAGILLE